MGPAPTSWRDSISLIYAITPSHCHNSSFCLLKCRLIGDSLAVGPHRHALGCPSRPGHGDNPSQERPSTQLAHIEDSMSGIFDGTWRDNL